MNCVICSKPSNGNKYCGAKACYGRAHYLRHTEAVKEKHRDFYYRKYGAYEAYRNSLLQKYTRQARRAGDRDIGWEFTYESWLTWWGDDISNRGARKGQLVMARRGDVGPYSETNCIKITCGENVASAHRKVVH